MLVQNEDDVSDTARDELRRRWHTLRMTTIPPNLSQLHFSQDEIDEIDSGVNNNNRSRPSYNE